MLKKSRKPCIFITKNRIKCLVALLTHKKSGQIKGKSRVRCTRRSHMGELTMAYQHSDRGVRCKWGGGPKRGGNGAYRPATGHAALRVKEAQVAAGDPVSP